MARPLLIGEGMRRGVGGLVLVVVLCAGRAHAQAPPSPDAGTPPEADAAPEEDAPPEVEAADEPAAARYVVLDDTGRRVDVGCTVSTTLRHGDAVYVVCDDGRLLWVDGIEGWVEHVEVFGRAVGLFERDGRPWVEVVRREAVALERDGGGDAQPAQPAPPPARFDRFEDEPRGGEFDAPPAAATPPRTDTRNAVRSSWYPAESEWPPRQATDPERPTAAAGRARPVRHVGWELRGSLRPFLGGEGGGLVAELAATHRFDAPIVLDFEVDPVGFAIGDNDSVGLFGASALLGYDHGLFQIGMGVGTWYVEVFEFERFAEGLGTALRQNVRLGRRDGSHVEATTTFVLVDGEMFFGSIEGTMQVDLSEGTWLLVRGGGGKSRYGYGEMALRVTVSEPGAETQVFVVPGIGGAAVLSEREDFAGLSMSFGVEVRP